MDIRVMIQMIQRRNIHWDCHPRIQRQRVAAKISLVIGGKKCCQTRPGDDRDLCKPTRMLA